LTKEISLEDYLKTLKSGWKLFVFIPLLAILLSTLHSTYFTKPVYETTAKILVQKKSNMQFNVVHSVATYLEISQSKDVLNALDSKTNYIKEGISLIIRPQGEVIYFEVTGANPKNIAGVANTASELAILQAKKIDGMDILKIVERADVPAEPIEPGKARGMAGAGILGFILAFGIVTIRGFLKS
jgi:capsular polysaccharide biosynthesis protein